MRAADDGLGVAPELNGLKLERWNSPDGRSSVGVSPRWFSVCVARWRGHTLARFADATAVLTDALSRLDPTFVRAETALRVDLAIALAATGDRDEASTHAHHAARVAAQVGSLRQCRRVKSLLPTIAKRRAG